MHFHQPHFIKVAEQFGNFADSFWDHRELFMHSLQHFTVHMVQKKWLHGEFSSRHSMCALSTFTFSLEKIRDGTTWRILEQLIKHTVVNRSHFTSRLIIYTQASVINAKMYSVTIKGRIRQSSRYQTTANDRVKKAWQAYSPRQVVEPSHQIRFLTLWELEEMQEEGQG